MTTQILTPQLSSTQKTIIVQKAYKYALDLVEKHCAEYNFHNPSHTKNVFERATYLGMIEGLNYNDLEDLQIAALFHDTGFMKQYAKNEYVGSQIARKWLEKEGHPENRIKKIEDIIMATVLFSKPKNILEEIIQDSDMDNIGTRSGFKNSESLFHEIREIAGVNISECAFWQFTYKVYFHYKFHTKTAREERNHQQSLNLKLVEAYCNSFACEIPVGYDHLERIV